MKQKSARSLLWYFIIVFVVIAVSGYYKTKKPQTESVGAKTSQILQPAAEESPKVLETSQYALPVLLGKTQGEVVNSIGVPDGTSNRDLFVRVPTNTLPYVKNIRYTQLCWEYGNKPFPWSNVDVLYDPVLPGTSLENVRVVRVKFSDNNQPFLSAGQIIPEELSSVAPSAYYFKEPGWCILGVVLYQTDSTFIVFVKSENQKFYQVSKSVNIQTGQVATHYSLSDNAKNWIDCEAIYLLQVKGAKRFSEVMNTLGDLFRGYQLLWQNEALQQADEAEARRQASINPADEYLGTWRYSDQYKTISLRFSQNGFEYKDIGGTTFGVRGPRRLEIKGTWRYERGRVKGRGVGIDGKVYVLDASKTCDYEIFYAVMNERGLSIASSVLRKNPRMKD